MQKAKILIILLLPFLMCSAIKKTHFDNYYLLSAGYLSEIRLDGSKLIELQTIRLIDSSSHETFLDTLIKLDIDTINKIIEIIPDVKNKGLIYITFSKQQCDSCRLILFSEDVFNSFTNLKNPHQITKIDLLRLINIIEGCTKKYNPKGSGLIESQIYFNSVLFLLGYNPLISLEQFHDIAKGL